jgi:signal transduction histidine kinase
VEAGAGNDEPLVIPMMGGEGVRGLPETESGRESPELREAADAVIAELSDADVAVPVSDVRSALAELVGDLESGAESGGSNHDPSLRRRLLELLRARLIRQWQASLEPPDPRRMLELLTRMERAATDLDSRIPGASTIGYPTALEFVAGVAHDLRSPLTSILFLTETLRAGQSGPVNDVQRRQLGIAYAAALGLVSVASDIIELVRGGEGLVERKPSPFSVREMFDSIHDIVRPMADERGLSLHLFPPAEDHRFGHALALSRVLLNLTTNGLKYTDSGFVEISGRELGDHRVEFSVRDTGRGFPPEALENLYSPFRRSASGRGPGFSGSGLGLAISRKLVAAMGASLDVEVRPGWGTRFFFELHLPLAAGRSD